MIGPIILYGDPHGDWQPLLHACIERPPACVVILGDCDLTRPFRDTLRPIFDAAIRIRWIPGNHDADTAEWHDNLWGDYPEGNLHVRSAKLGSWTVAGLGGVFKPAIWYPKNTIELGAHATRDGLLRRLHPKECWRGGLPLHFRDAVFPEDLQTLAGLSAEILVTHEAPSCHVYGFVGVDHAARACGAKLIIHGHHHTSTTGTLKDGIRVRGLAKSELFWLEGSECGGSHANA